LKPSPRKKKKISHNFFGKKRKKGQIGESLVEYSGSIPFVGMESSNLTN
jgi:hypothetical protein